MRLILHLCRTPLIGVYVFALGVCTVCEGVLRDGIHRDSVFFLTMLAMLILMITIKMMMYQIGGKILDGIRAKVIKGDRSSIYFDDFWGEFKIGYLEESKGLRVSCYHERMMGSGTVTMLIPKSELL